MEDKWGAGDSYEEGEDEHVVVEAQRGAEIAREQPTKGSRKRKPPPDNTKTSHCITEFFQRKPKRAKRMMMGEDQGDLLGADGDWPSFEERMANPMEPIQEEGEEQQWEEWGEVEDSICVELTQNHMKEAAGYPVNKEELKNKELPTPVEHTMVEEQREDDK